MKKHKARMGRPPKGPQDRRSMVVLLRLTPGEYRRLAGAAKVAGLPLATFIRNLLTKGRNENGGGSNEAL